MVWPAAFFLPKIDHSEFKQFTNQVDEHHFVDRTGGGTSDTRVSDDYRQALGTRDGDIESIAVEDKGKPARAVFAVAGTEGKNADGSLLPLKLVYAADPSASLKRGLKRSNLGVVRGDEKKVRQGQRPRVAILVSVGRSVSKNIPHESALNLRSTDSLMEIVKRANEVKMNPHNALKAECIVRDSAEYLVER